MLVAISQICLAEEPDPTLIIDRMVDAMRGDASYSEMTMFDNGLFVVTELLYNKDGGNRDNELPRQPFPSGLAADNPSLTRYQGALQLSFLVHPLVISSLTSVYFFQEKALFVSPALIWSVRQNLDLTVSAQLFNGGSNTLLEQAADLYMASLKYNF